MALPRTRYRLGRRLKSSRKARLDYITYLNSDGMPTRQLEAIDPDAPVIRRLGARFGLGGLLRVVPRVEHFLTITADLGGQFRANIFPPVTIKPNFALGGNMTAAMGAIPKQLAARFGLGGSMEAHLDGLTQIELSAVFSGGGSMRAELAPVQLGAVFSGGGSFTMTGALVQRMRARFGLGGSLIAQVTREIALRPLFALGGALTINVSTDMTLDSDAQAIVDAMTTEPSGPQKTKINTAVVDLKTAGLWAKLNTFHVFDANAEQSALIDWKNPTGTLATNSGCTFVPNDSFVRTAGAQKILVPFTPGGLFTQDNAAVGVYVKEGAAGDNRYISTNRTAGGFITLTLNSTPQMQCALNDTTADTYARTAGSGLYFASRDASANKRLQKENSVLGTATTVSTAVPSCTLLHVFDGALGSSGAVQAAFTASALSQSEGNTLAGIIAAYIAAPPDNINFIGASTATYSASGFNLTVHPDTQPGDTLVLVQASGGNDPALIAGWSAAGTVTTVGTESLGTGVRTSTKPSTGAGEVVAVPDSGAHNSAVVLTFRGVASTSFRSSATNAASGTSIAAAGSEANNLTDLLLFVYAGRNSMTSQAVTPSASHDNETVVASVSNSVSLFVATAKPNVTTSLPFLTGTWTGGVTNRVATALRLRP